MNYHPSFDCGKSDNIQATAPLGWGPDGQWIESAENLPDLPNPRLVRVANDALEIDGWVFPLPYVTRSFLEWLQASFLRWLKEDESAQNREWIDGIVEAFQDALAGNP